MTVFTVEDPVFKTEPMFIGNCSYDEMRAYLKKHFRVSVDPDDAASAGRMLTFACAPWRVVWVRRVSRSSRHLAVLIHEVFHLVTHICYDRNIPIVAYHVNNANGDETAAYLHEFFVHAVLMRVR